MLINTPPGPSPRVSSPPTMPASAGAQERPTPDLAGPRDLASSMPVPPDTSRWGQFDYRDSYRMPLPSTPPSGGGGPPVPT